MPDVGDFGGGFPDLASVIDDPLFPRLDQALRSGLHVDRRVPGDYHYLVDAQKWLEHHYQRYGADLVHAPDGFFYLRPVGDRLPVRRLTPAEMLVGQTLALFALEPATLEAGHLTRAQILERLRDLMGTDKVLRALRPKAKAVRAQHRAEAEARQALMATLKRLARLGFVDLLDDDRVAPRDALMRFVEPARGAEDLVAALERLVRAGDVELLTEDDAAEDSAAEDAPDEDAAEAEDDDEESP